MNKSKILEQIAESNRRVISYEYDPENDMGIHWLHLRYPFTSDGTGSIHESTVKDCLDKLLDLD